MFAASNIACFWTKNTAMTTHHYKEIAAIRKDYSLRSLDINDVNPNPILQFQHWLDEAIKSEVHEPTAMNLATVSVEGRPSGRILLLKGVDRGFVFFTNYNSRKGHDLNQNAAAAMTFFWPELERQVRVEGFMERVSAQESDEYFHSRPRMSRLGAWASSQSQPIEDRSVIEHRISELLAQYGEEEPLPRPEGWGGYRLMADRLEFWQGRPSRLHDRIAYTLQPAENWKIERLSP